MNAIKSARKFIESEPEHPDAEALSALVLALESETPFPLGRLYEMELDHFELALAVLGQWRLDRYYSGKAKLLMISMQRGELERDVDPGQ
jgi:hypothetical protein